MESNVKDLFEDVPAEIIGLISTNLKFKDLNALLTSNTRLRKLLARNELWRDQIVHSFKTTAYLTNQNCQEIFQKLYINRLQFQEAQSGPFKSNYVPLTVISTDGGEYGDPYGVKNLIVDDMYRVYCTQSPKTENINVVMGVKDDKLSFIRSIKIEGPSWGYTAPIDSGLIFFFDQLPELKEIAEFDAYTKDQWEKLSEVFNNDVEALKQAKCPVAYFNGLSEGRNRRLYINFEFPYLTAKYIVLKMLTSGGDKVNIDIASFIAYGAPADELKSNVRAFNSEVEGGAALDSSLEDLFTDGEYDESASD